MAACGRCENYAVVCFTLHSFTISARWPLTAAFRFRNLPVGTRNTPGRASGDYSLRPMIFFRNYPNWQTEMRGVMARLWQGKKYTVDKDWNLRIGPVMNYGDVEPADGSASETSRD